MVAEGQYQRKADSNSLGLTGRKGTRAVTLLTEIWQKPEDDDHVYAAVADLVTALEDKARSLNAYDPFLYLNHAAPWPTLVFTKPVPEGFKIPDIDGS
jgi:hypothetical protein